MKIIRINESQFSKCFINEYHHAYGNGLEQDAENIANMLCDRYSDGWRAYFDVKNGSSSGTPILYQTSSFGDGRNISIYLTNLDNSFYIPRSTNLIVIGEYHVIDALKSKNMQRLASCIYHELGHMTNVVKSDRLSQIKKDFKTPLFLGMNQQDYEDIEHILYRFHTRELKARCFETTMFLKKNDNPNITIQDVYNNRCSDITLMRGFVNYLKSIAEEGKGGSNAYIINDLFKDTYGNRMSYNARGMTPWEKKCRGTIWYFESRYIWLKKRIDKIFSDYKLNY